VAGRGLALTASLILGVWGCRASQPIRLSIQDTWTDDERAELVQDTQRWEIATRGRVQFIISPVPFHDPDGFNRADLDDGVSVIYKIDQPGAVDWLSLSNGHDLYGYNFDTTDILIFAYKLDGLLDPTATHELGHHLGLGHVRVHPAIMNDVDEQACITQWDLEAFCQIYDCSVADTQPECVMPP
jgi:hypothetical protein